MRDAPHFGMDPRANIFNRHNTHYWQLPRRARIMTLREEWQHSRLKRKATSPYNMERIMSKSQDTKKAVKKEPAKTPKEKKEAKKIKKEASKRQ